MQPKTTVEDILYQVSISNLITSIGTLVEHELDIEAILDDYTSNRRNDLQFHLADHYSIFLDMNDENDRDVMNKLLDTMYLNAVKIVNGWEASDDCLFLGVVRGQMYVF